MREWARAGRFGRNAAGVVAAVMLAATPAAFAAEPADGLYLMTRFWQGSGLETRAFLFRGGQVAANPSGDLSRYDFAAARRSDPAGVGSLRRSGDKLAVTWGNGSTTESTFSSNPPCFGWNAGIFCPVTTFGRGEMLEGTFEGGSSAGGTVGTTSLTFFRDGRYRSANILTTRDGGVAREGTGRYELSGTTLRLTPDDGPPRAALSFPYDLKKPGAKPDGIYFEGTMMLRRK